MERQIRHRIGSAFQRRGQAVLNRCENVVMLMKPNRQKDADPRLTTFVGNCRFGNITLADHHFLNGPEMQLLQQHPEVIKAYKEKLAVFPQWKDSKNPDNSQDRMADAHNSMPTMGIAGGMRGVRRPCVMMILLAFSAIQGGSA